MTEHRAIVLETEWFTVEALMPKPEWNIASKPYYRILAPDSVVVLPITTDGKVLLVRQYRPARGRKTWEIPAGSIEPGEDAIKAAARELLEETAHSSDRIHSLGRGGLNLSRESAWVNAYVAFGVRPHSKIKSGEHGIEIAALSFAEFNGIVHAGDFEQLAALGVVALAKARFPRELALLLAS
jgi:ADP-ribose pyrophosphatase